MRRRITADRSLIAVSLKLFTDMKGPFSHVQIAWIFQINVLLILLELALGIPIDNGVEGEPEIRCSQGSIAVVFATRDYFEGHVFVKGRYNEPGCRTEATQQLTAGIELPFSTCGVRRVRSANPRGIFVETTVVITFHPNFITKVDRAYTVQCFYMEADKTVTTNLDVSMLTTLLRTVNVPMPVCQYQVLSGGYDGVPARFARVGDPVYHKWICLSETDNVFCMTVHSCYVDDGAGKTIQLMDQSGCSIDRYLLGNLEYTGDLVAGREVHVFKYADKPNLYFNCQIKISVKEDGGYCDRQQCAEPVRARLKRTVTAGNHPNKTLEHRYRNLEMDNVDVDVVAEPLTVLEIDSLAKNKLPQSGLPLGASGGAQAIQPIDDQAHLCMTIGGFSLLVFFAAVILILCVVVLIVTYRKGKLTSTGASGHFKFGPRR